MNLDQDIRTMLRARAEGVAAAPMIPHSTLRRVRVRKTLMTGSVAAVVAALVFGGFAASRPLLNDAAPIPPAGKTEAVMPQPSSTPESTVDVTDEPWDVIHRSNMTTPYVSRSNGYSFKYWDRGGLEPAKELWDPANQPSPVEGLGGYGAEYKDEFDVVETGYGAFFMSASTKIPAGVPVDEWADEALAKYLPAGCYGPRSQQERITIDGEPGRISQDCAEDVVATVVTDRRLYLFVMAHSAPSRDDARQVFEAWLATVELTPETAAAP